MTGFKKHGNIVLPLMASKNDTIVRLPNGDVQIDPQGRRAKVERWFAELTKNGDLDYDKFSDIVSKDASRLMVQFFHDMYIGKNLSKGKGKKPLAPNNLFNYITRLPPLVQKMEAIGGRPLLELNEDHVLTLFKGMRDGILLTKKGTPFKDTQTYAKFFCSFWRWYMRLQNQKKIPVIDLVGNVDLSRNKKPHWNYFTLEDVKRMADHAPSLYYKALVLFLFDSGLRPPKELMNVRVKDITPIPDSNNCFLQIRDETSKTFGRKIKLMICSEVLKKYIRESGKEPDDFIFHVGSPSMANVLKKMAYKVLGKGKMVLHGHAYRVHGGIKMYDFRHCSVCHYLPIYKSENQMKYRYGWKRAEMIHYYSEFMGMRDTISESDLISDDTKVKMQVDLEKEKQKVTILQEQLMAQKQEMDEKMKKLETMMLQRFAQDY